MRRALIGCLLLALFAQGCSLGAKEAWVEAIRDGFETVREIGGSRVRQVVTLKVIETNIRQPPKPLIASSEGLVDFDMRRAKLVESAKRKAQVVYDDLVVYLSRSKSSIGKSKQPWAKFDFEREPSVDIDDNDRRLAVGAALISPALAVEFLEGVLTGSVDQKAAGRMGGARATRYSARLAPDAVVTEIRNEDRKEGITRLFESLAIQQDDFPVDVWLDSSDRVRGVRFVMRQQKDRVNAFEMSVTWSFYGFGRAPKIAVPSANSTTRPGRFRDFVEDLIREF